MIDLLNKILNFGIGYVIICGVFTAIIFVVVLIFIIKIAKRINDDWKK